MNHISSFTYNAGVDIRVKVLESARIKLHSCM